MMTLAIRTWPLRWVAGMLLLLPLVAGAQRTAGENIDDATLATRVKGALVDAPKVSALKINVEVYNGHVQLGGFVESSDERDAALAAAERIGAATRVIDAMVVLPGHRSIGETVDDTAIQARLKVKLADVQGLGKAHKINTEVRQGHVLLSGFVGTATSRDEAGRIAAGISGVVKVHNKLSAIP
jgi:hyperosmotically inducible protein